MIYYFSENNYKVKEKLRKRKWIYSIIRSEGKIPGNINYIFCSDEYLLKINKEYLNHDYYTDIITFDYRLGNIISGDIYISIDRIGENSKKHFVLFEEELKRVIIHGILHILGFKDSTKKEKDFMRKKEEECLKNY